MKKYLVIGLTSSCTKIVSRMLAVGCGIINDIEDWDGKDQIGNKEYLITHRSLPHGKRSLSNRWIDPEVCLEYDYVVIVTRDINCSKISSIKDHQPDKDLANEENKQGIKIMQNILKISPSVKIFSYETAQILQEYYTIPFMKKIEIEYPQHIYFKNVNEKYIGDTNV